MAEVDNKSVIYQLINLIDGKFYVGSAIIFRKRRDLHKLELRKNKHHNRYLQSAWNKYGEDAFEFRVLEIVENRKELNKKEQVWLDWLTPHDHKIGYNLCKNVERSRLGLKSTKEHIEKIANANRGQKRSKETCIKIGLAKKGTKLTEEQKQARRNYRHTEETKNKIAASKLGHKHTNEAKLKMSEKASVRVSRPISLETRKKLSEAAFRQWNDKLKFQIIDKYVSI